MPAPASATRPLAVSMGEPAGIGPDIILAAWTALAGADPLAPPPFVVFGDPGLFESRARMLGIGVRIAVLAPGDTPEPDAMAVVATSDGIADQPGVLDPATGPSTVAALSAALDAVREGACSALVTAPIHKANLYATGFGFPGHTEYLEAVARERFGVADAEAVMMLAGPALRTVPVTVHIPLAEVPHALTADRIVRVGHIVDRDLRQRFGIAQPRLVLAGLNPHAGESGTLGAEDLQIIAPAVERLRDRGIAADGPLPADTLFHEEARAGYDAALCMYHDQALVPVKTLDLHRTVNVTLGLPFVRTSPDHGTALDRAGTGTASPGSMIAALTLARTLAQRTLQPA